MSINAICSTDNNKFLPEVYLSDLKTDSLALQNSTVSGYTPSNLNYYEELSFTPTWSNINTIIVGTGKVKLARINNNVILSFDDYIGAISAAPVVSNAFIPSRFCPVGQDSNSIISIQSNGTPTAAVLEVKQNGTIQIYSTTNTDTPNWPAAGDSGWIRGSITYSVDIF
jgi:hypothetical protein